MKILEAIAHLRANSPKRAFTQSFDLAITLVGIDPKRPEGRLVKEVVLPHGRGKPARVCLISDTAKFEHVIGKAKLAELEANKAAAKAFVRSYEWFIAEAPLMATVGRALGRYLGPRGKMPKLLPPGTDPAVLAEQLSRTVLLRVKDSPALHCVVGNEAMSDEQIAENARKVLDEVRASLPPKARIKAAWLKLTMSQAVQLDV